MKTLARILLFLLGIALLPSIPVIAQTAQRYATPYTTAFDSTGVVSPGAKLNFYATGSSSRVNTYSNAGLTIANSNPVVANGAGLFGSIFLIPNQQYKVVLTDANDNVIWTADPVYNGSGGSGNGVIYVSNIAALKALGTFSPSYAEAVVNGYTTANDGGQGIFYWADTCPSTVDNGIYIQATGVSSSKCWVRQFSNTVNLAWYGISALTDIATPIGSAIAALGTRGNISMPQGTLTYYINSQIAIGAKKITFDLGGNTLQVHASFTGSMFYSGVANGQLILKNGTLDGNKASFTITGYGINVGAVATAPEIYGVTLQNFPTDATSLFGGGTTIVENSNANDNGASGWVGQPVGVMKFTNSGGTGNTSFGGAFAGSLGTSVVGGEWNNNVGGGLGFYWGKNGASFAVNARAVNVNASGNTGTGIAVGQGIHYSTVVGSTVQNNGSIGINVDTILNDGVTAADCYCTVTGNTISGASLSLRWNGAKNGSVVGNTFIDPTDAGLGAIYSLSGSNNLLVDGNTFIGSNAWIQIGTTTTVSVGTGNKFLGLSSTLTPTGGAGLLQQPVTYWAESANTSFGNVFPAELYDIDTTSASFTKTLPAAATLGNGQHVRFYKKVAANSLTIQLTAGEHFYPDSVTGGAPTTTADTYTNAGWTVEYVSINDGTNVGWFRVP